MASAPSDPAIGASEALAAFAVGPHPGAGFDDARKAARDRLARARERLPGGAGEASLIGAFSRALELLMPGAPAAPDAVVIAAALGAGVIVQASDDVVVDAIAVGREAAARLAASLTLDSAWDAPTVIDAVAAGLAAARAAGLDAAQAGSALGLVVTEAAGLGALASGGFEPIRDLFRAKSAADAVEAAILARNGFTAAPRSLEGRRGLAVLMGSRLDEERVTEGLGSQWVSAR